MDARRKRIAIEHYEAIGGISPMQEAGEIWVIREHKIEYLFPAFVGEAIEIKTWVENVQHVGSLCKYEFVRSQMEES